MKRIFTILTVTFMMLITFESVAQMSRSEKREWKKRLRALTEEQYKALLEDQRSLTTQVSSLRTELDEVDSQLASKDEQINQYAAQNANCQDQLAQARANARPGGMINDQVGIVFKVQIGAYREITLSEDNSPEFGSETVGDVNKYTIGVFTDYWKADTFKKYIREMGVKDAWIVAYKDGRRVNIEEVLAGDS
jgi:hypothetical protein